MGTGEIGQAGGPAHEAGQPEHWLMVEFRRREVFFVRLYWERLNVEGFVLEASEDGENWVQAADWEGEQEANAQSIVLDKVVNGRFSGSDNGCFHCGGKSVSILSERIVA